MSGEDVRFLGRPLEAIPSFAVTYQEVVSEVVSLSTPEMQALLDPTAREVLAVTCGAADHPIEEEAVGCGDAR